MKNPLLSKSIGRRKTSIARVSFFKGKGQIIINNRPIENYFKRETALMIINQPLELVDSLNKYNINVKVFGGGISGQAGAIRLGIARCLQDINQNFRAPLKKAVMLRRDSRKVERKKYGQPGARKKFQFSKR